MSLISALNAAVSGLRATQAGIDLVSQNVANADSIGYTKRRLEYVQAVTNNRTAGVRAGEIERVFDRLTLAQLRTETAGANYTAVRADYAGAIDRLFGAPGSTASLDFAFNDFKDQLNRLFADPADYSSRRAVLDRAGMLAGRIATIAEGIQGLRSQAEGQIANAVDRVNELLSGIDRTTQAINSAVGPTGNAALEDDRDRMINELSSFVDIQVRTTDRGGIRISTGSGFTLYDGVNAVRLSFDERGAIGPEDMYVSGGEGGGVIRAGGTGLSSVDLIAAGTFRSGTIGAYLEMRDTILVQAQRQLDELAGGLARAFSDVQAPVTGNVITTASLQPGNAVSIDLSVGGTYQRITVNAPNAATAVTVADLQAAIGAVFPGATVADDGGGNWVIGGAPAPVTVIGASFTRTALAGGAVELPFFVDKTAGGVPFTGADGQGTGLAQRLAVNSALLANQERLVTYAPGTSQGDTARPGRLVAALSDIRLVFPPQAGVGGVAAPFTTSIGEFTRRVVDFQGANAETARRLDEGQRIALSVVESRFAETAAVNVDEEMAQLLRLQTAYGANARIMTAVRDMMDMLMRI